VAGTRTAVTLDRGGLDICLNATVIENASACRTTPADRPATDPGAGSGSGAGTGDVEPVVAARAAVIVEDRLDICLGAAVLGTTTACGTEPATQPRTDGNNLDLCLTATLSGGTAGCGTDPGNRSVADVAFIAATVLDPIALDACLNVGVPADAASCKRDTTAAAGNPGSEIPVGGVDVCLAIGSISCDSPAATNGVDPGTNPEPGTVRNYGNGVSPADHDNAARGGRDMLAGFGNALSAGTYGLPGSRGLALTGSALAGTALALIALGFLLMAGARRRRTA
jgi:hypothetical protein